ncbi:MAG: hypothetical protein ACYDCK_03965 [Thermoplasmatota archaeon]
MTRPTRRGWKRWWPLALVLVLLPPAAFAFYLTWPPAFFPHDRIVISLPFEANDTPSYMIPMGETIYHPKPQVPHGHPGVDFQWANGTSHALLAVADGVFWSAKLGASEPGKWDIEVKSGEYLVRYKELDDYNASLHFPSHVAKGQIIAHAGHYCDPQHCWFNVHWELASMSTLQDRWCPVTYFDDASRAAIERVWANVPANDTVKSRFPDICSGDYTAKSE